MYKRQVLRLSDAFEKKVSSPELEVTVTMLNINPGNNRELMEKCRTLREYCMFVECIRKYAEQMDIGLSLIHISGFPGVEGLPHPFRGWKRNLTRCI